MSWTHVLTTHEFWTGGIVVGALGSIGTYFTTRASDRRKFVHEDEVITRQETRDDKLRDQESLYSGAQEFAQVATDILTDTIDAKGIFNILRDWYLNQTGQPDPKASEKFDHGEKVLEAQKRIAVPLNKLKLVAAPAVLDAASRVNMALTTIALWTTEPVARRSPGRPLARR
jgi:hypothetical protein